MGAVSNNPYTSFLYVPHDMGYVKNDKMCGGSTGYAVVQFISFRQTILNILSSSPTKFLREESKTTTSKKKIYIIYSMPWFLPNMKQKQEKNHSEISDLRMSSSVKTKRLELAASTPSHTNKKAIKSWWTLIVLVTKCSLLLKI